LTRAYCGIEIDFEGLDLRSISQSHKEVVLEVCCGSEVAVDFRLEIQEMRLGFQNWHGHMYQPTR
jgi:hypothetical protein